MFSQCVIFNDCCRIWGFLYKCFGNKGKSSMFLCHVNKPKLDIVLLRNQQQCSSHGMSGTSQLEILCKHLAAGAQRHSTTLSAKEFHVKILLVHTELVNNIFLWKYCLTGQSHG